MGIELIVNLATSVLAVDFVTQYCQPQYEGSKAAKRGFLAVFAYFSVVTLLNLMVPFEGVLGFTYLLVLLVYGQTSLRGNMADHLLATILWAVIVLLSTVFVFQVIGLIIGDDVDEFLAINHYLRAESLAVITILKISLSCFVLLVKTKTFFYLEQHEGHILMGIGLIMVIIVLTFFNIELNIDNENARRILSMVLFLGFIAIIFAVYHIFSILSKRNEERITAEITREGISKQGEYVKDIEDLSQKIQKQVHDMKGHLNIISTYLKNGRYEESINYIKELDSEISQYTYYQEYTKNAGLNAVLSRITQECKEKNISFSLFIAAEPKKIKELDMGILMFNLLRNAVEAAEKTDSGQILLEMENFHNYLKCTLQNSIPASVLKNNPTMKTSKNDKENHGFGIKSICEVISKYDGYYKKWEEQDQFIQEIYLKYPDEGENSLIMQ